MNGNFNDSEWKAFKAGFLAAREFYNDNIADKKNKWVLLPDKAIGNAFNKYKKTDKLK